MRRGSGHGFGVGPNIEQAGRRLDATLRPIQHPLALARFQSPLRYPGAKSSLAPVISRFIVSAKGSPEIHHVDLIVEPFAGGASASLRMVGEGTVDRILLADADPLVAAFWQVAAADTDRLKERMRDEWRMYVKGGGATAVDRWDHWRTWQPRSSARSAEQRLGAAVKCLFLNRTTFSGILHGKAGPLGGRSQTSDYPINCRWNPDDLERRLDFVGHLYATGRLVDVWRKDWRATLEDVPERYPQLLPSRVVAYLDPPYVEKSSTLYRKSFDPHGGYGGFGSDTNGGEDSSLHLGLASYLRTKAQFRWLLSYDNHPSLTQSPWLYARDRMTPTKADRQSLGIKSWRISKRVVSTRYTAAGRVGKRAADELFFTTFPPSTVPTDERIRPFDVSEDRRAQVG